MKYRNYTPEIKALWDAIDATTNQAELFDLMYKLHKAEVAAGLTVEQLCGEEK